MSKSSTIFQRILLVLAALAVFGVVAWAGLRVFEPAPFTPVPSPRARVIFDVKSDIRQNQLFNILQAVVTGEIEPGALGRPNPFVGPMGGGSSGLAPSSRLAVAEEIPLGGARAVALARGAGGDLLVLLAGKKPDGSEAYEIRAYAANNAASTFTAWTYNGDASLRPVALTQDSAGAVWLGSATGRLGAAAKGQAPVWKPAIDAAEPRSIRRMLTNGAGQVWATDGLRLIVAGEGMQPISFFPSTAVSAEERQIFDERLSVLPGALKQFVDYQQLSRGYDPERLYLLADGRIAAVTGFTTFLFGQSLSAAPERVDTLATSSLPLAVAPNGDVWARRFTDNVLTRVWSTGTQAYLDPYAFPKQAPKHPELFASDLSSLYALDYSPTSTVLWYTDGDGWLAQVAAASGTLPRDTPVSVEADGAGSVWAVMQQGGLVRIKRPAKGM